MGAPPLDFDRVFIVWVRGVMVKTYGYSAEGPGFDPDSGQWKFQHISRVFFTLPHTSLLPRPEFKLEWVLWGPR